MSPLPINPLVAGLGSPPIPEARMWLSRYDGGRGAAIDLSQAVPGYPPALELLERSRASTIEVRADVERRFVDKTQTRRVPEARVGT